MHVRDCGVDPERAQIGNARDHIAASHQHAFLVQCPGHHAIAVGAGGGEIELTASLGDLLAERTALERQALALSLIRLLNVVSFSLDLFQFDQRLGFRQVRLPQLFA